MPLSVADTSLWRSQRLALRWARQQSGGLEWDLWPATIDGGPNSRYSCLAYKETERGRRPGSQYTRLFPSFKKRFRLRAADRHNLQAFVQFLEHPPLGQVFEKLGFKPNFKLNG